MIVARCHLCRADDDLEQAGSLWWCRDRAGCYLRARRRLGVPDKQTHDLYRADRAAAQRDEP